MNALRGKTGAVVVFYHPDASCVARANRLAKLCMCVVVDNSPRAAGDSRPLGLDRTIIYVPNGANLGVATALNQGVERLIAEGCGAALLFDQDSEPDAGLIEELPRILASCVSRGQSIAMVGPAYADVRLGGVAPFVRFGPCWLKRIEPHGREAIDVDFLITSGSCIDLDAWKAVGAMEDSLFIDFVDLEWCARAQQHGYRVLGVPWVKMEHELGDTPVMLLGRPYPMHSPMRHYFMFRNAIVLIRRGYMPFSWKLSELVKMPVRLVIYGTLAPQRLKHLRMCARGIWDGVLNRVGPGKNIV